MHAVRGGTGRRVVPANLALLAVLSLFAQVVLPVTPAAAAPGPTLTITGGMGTYSSGGNLYASTGETLTATFSGANGGAHCAALYLGSTTSSSEQIAYTTTQSNGDWVMAVTLGQGLLAGLGDGSVTLTGAAGTSNNSPCNANKGSATAAFIVDNTAPVASAPTITPLPNGAGWNRSSSVNVELNLSDDSGSGVKTTTYSVGYKTQPANCTANAYLPNGFPVGAQGDGTYFIAYCSTDNVGNLSGSYTAQVQVDTTKPTIIGSRSPAPNANGWNNSDVSVTFTCSDATSGVSGACGPNATVSTEGQNQSVTGSVADAAGNANSTSVSSISVDKTPPTLSGTATTPPNANGWYNSAVTIHWTCTDSLSGFTAGACPVDSTLTTEGTSVTTSASVSDKAGNVTTATSAPVRIDTTPPVTQVVAPSGWNNSDVQLSLNPTDNLSGVAATYYTLDGGSQQSGTAVSVSVDGVHTLRFWSVDSAGNSEATKSVQVKIDNTPPSISHVFSPAPNSYGWFNSDVTVTFSCDDALSGVASCDGIAGNSGATTVTTEGQSQSVTGVAVDNAGNSASDPVSVSIDKTKPSISGAPDRAANANGWYNAPVTVTFACNDTLSGLVGPCGPAHMLSSDGAGQQASGTVSDAAGNTNSTTVSGINIDQTPPTITGAPTSAPNADGWYHGDVTIHWTCKDGLSGIASGACPADSVITGEGDNLGASASVSDRAGNIATGSVSGIKIDRTAPTTTASAVPSGWTNAPVAVTLSPSDMLSGIKATYFSVDGGAPQTGTSYTFSTDGVHTLQFWSVDVAGNVEDKTAAGHALTIKIDQTNPTISATVTPAANAHGWNNADVVIHFDCADPASGAGVVASGVASCTADQTISTEGTGQQVTGAVADNAGNLVSVTVGNINIDTSAPTLSGTPMSSPNADGWYNGNVTIHWTASDTVSGVDPATTPADATLTGEGRGLQASASVTDLAGNATTANSASVNIDRTPPMIIGQPTTSPDGYDAQDNGWYRGDVTIAWSCRDPQLADTSDGSGVASCQSYSTITGEGADLTATGTSTDKAGNSATTASQAVNIDRTPPTTKVTAPAGWNNSDVTVTLDAHDALSGVQATYYILDNGAQQAYGVDGITINTEGKHTLEFWSVDNAGNVESTKSVDVNIDKTAPTISHQQSPAANSNGWNNSDVTVTFSCGDALSGIASCTLPQTISSEGKDQAVTGTAKDNAGNIATDPATVSIDKTPPSISGAPSTAANANGWYNSAVTIHWTCGDNLSGVASCPNDSIISGDGQGQSVSATATDAAGNSASADSPKMNIDTTPPTITGSPVQPANANGWYNGDVTIHWTCGDNLSGLDGDCPADSLISGEGDNLQASAMVSDLAGNSSTGTVSGIKIDRTPPSTSWSATADYTNSDGVRYYAHAFNVTLFSTDTGSGVETTYYVVDGGQQTAGTVATISGEGEHTLAFWSVDKAGNVEQAQTATFRIDTTAPGIKVSRTPANTNGWNNGPVKVTFACADPSLADGKAGSGVASCDGSTTVSQDGRNQQVTGTTADNVGNSANLTVDNINIDTVKPTVSGAPDRAANTNGWYNANVTVNFTCHDDLSGVASCSDPVTLSRNGKGQSVQGTVTDNAGNSGTTTVDGINIDMVPPSLGGAPTTSPNSNGWYNGDVTVQWVCNDSLSGVDGNCPSDSLITGEGDNLGASATVSDRAGNVTSTALTGIEIDRMPPATSISAPNDWVNKDVTISLDATDNLSGVAATFYTINHGAMQTGTSFKLSQDGVYTIDYWSVDNAGNAEVTHEAIVKVDQTAPTIKHDQQPLANSDGWNNSDVTVTFTCDDNMSGVASCTSAQTVTTEGQGQQVVGTAVDNAGNSASDSATLYIDKTPPTINGAPDRPANANDWYNGDVTVTFTCQDELSGIKSCSTSQTLGEGKGQSVTGSAADKAGNSSSTALSGINIDETAPTLSGKPTTQSNSNGWYNGDVTVQWTCGDNLSGIVNGSCPADSVLTGEGSSVVASATVSDLAGNTTPASVSVQIDRHAPVTTASHPSGVFGNWYNGPVSVTLVPTDNASGVAATYYAVDGQAAQAGTQVSISGNGKHTLTYWSVDMAGNEEVHHSLPVWIDVTKPTISGAPTASANGNGWYSTPVTVHFTCNDAESGVSSCEGDRTLTGDGANQSVSGTVVDNVGNTNSATVSGISIDRTAPAVTVTVGNTTMMGGGTVGSSTIHQTIATPYTLGAAPTVSCSATDATSGLIAACKGVTSGGTSAGVGAFTYTASATDRAGNTTTVVVTYQVTYAFSGFLQPVNYTAHQIGESSSTFKAGSTVPMKFQLSSASGKVIQSASAPRWIDIVNAGTGSTPETSANAAPVTMSNGGNFASNGSQYQLDWSTKGLNSGTWYRVGVALDDGSTYMVDIYLR